MNKPKRSVPAQPGTLEKVLTTAQTAIMAIDSGVLTLDDQLDQAPEDCRRMLEHLLMQFYRYRKSIRKTWQKFCRKPPSASLGALFDAALTQCLFQSQVSCHSVVNVAVTLAKKDHADKFVNAVLRAALRENYQKPVRAQEILPDGVLKRWRKNFSPEQVEKFAGLFLMKPEFTFRVCRGAQMPDGCSAADAFEPFVFAKGAPGEILTSPEFARGDYYIQDPAASMAVSLAAEVLPHCRKMLDLCAAPGGKTLQAAELLPEGARIVAADISANRQKLTRENLQLRQINADTPAVKPENLSGSFDFVLADMPCSNSGVFRRRPDALWRFSEKSLAEVMKLQREIVFHAARLTAPGGYLLLSTCSIEADENEAPEKFLTGFRKLKSRTILPDESADGAFASLWQKLPG